MKKLRLKRGYLSLMLALPIFLSCSSMMDEIELPYMPPPVVVHAYLYPDMDEIRLDLRYAANIGSNTGNPYGDPVENAYIMIVSEIGDTIQLNYSHGRRLYTGNPETSQIKAGRKYFLRINHNDFESIEASTIVPGIHNSFYPVFIDSVIYSYRREFFIDCYINNKPGSINFYQLFGDAEGVFDCYTEDGLQTESFSNSLFGYSPIINTENSGDIIQSGKFSIPIRTAPDTCFYYPNFINLKLYSFDFHSYSYLLSIDEFLDASDNPFLEPQNIYTNIINGYGIFGAYSLSEKSFDWKTLINAQKE
ncbi:MAG: DUF4249 domain-containing protein [Bacteroidales bacterium]|nr:DUF4249 domain-containing protein [Bacteroidales bacterium]